MIGPLNSKSKLGLDYCWIIIQAVQIRDINHNGVVLLTFMLKTVKWPHEFVLEGITKDRVAYNQLNITQWIAGFCKIMREENCQETKN